MSSGGFMAEFLGIPVPPGSSLTPLCLALSSYVHLPAVGTLSVELQGVGADLEVHIAQAPEIQGTFLELGNLAAGLADQVVVMVFGQLEARSIP
jgi:hypothetical protein